MKIYRAVVAVTLAVFLAVPAMAGKIIGLVSVDEITAKENRFVQAQKEIDDMVDQFERQRDQYERELQDLSQKLERAQGDRRDNILQMYGQQMAEKSRAYQNFMAETFGVDGIIENKTDEIMGPLYDKLEQACKQVGERLQIPLIIDRESLGPLYAADTLDVTTEVLEDLKRIW
jgi:outer membrane protein